CAAGLASLEVITGEQLPQRAETLGEEMRAALRTMGNRHGGVREVRGLGMLIGLELASAERTRRFVERARARGAIVGWTLHSDRVIRLAPPLNISAGELAAGLEALDGALADTAGGRA